MLTNPQQPVKGKVLEKMLLKWSAESRRRLNATVQSPDLEQLPPHSDGVSRPPLPHYGSSSGGISISSSHDSGMLSPLKHAAINRLVETEDVSRQRRAQLEERAMFLRDDQLLNLGHDRRSALRGSDNAEHHTSLLQPSHALTAENVATYNEKMYEDTAQDKMTRPSDPMRELLGKKARRKSSGSGGSPTTDAATTKRPVR